MRKKFGLSLIGSMAIIVMALSTPASAGFSTYTVGSSGSTTAKTTFGLNETPFLYMKLPDDKVNFASSFWHAPDSMVYFASQGPGSTAERWISLTSWDTVKKVGDWSIDSNVFYSSGVTATSAASFTVTPEPLSTALFLVGGVPIALNLYRRRKHARAV